MTGDLTGHSIERYHVLELLGEGGMAVVYKAYDTRLECEVAIKFLRVENLNQVQTQKTFTRFKREAKSLANLTHPNIVKVTDFGEYRGIPYLVMPYLPGGTLKQMAGHPIPYLQAVRLLIPIARGLAYAHDQGIVHRDLKPSNILISQTGEPLLTDFGIAQISEANLSQSLTGTGVGIGTPEYMAPEQGLGEKVDGRADIYALGLVLYELLTGRKPFTADTPMAVIIKQIHDPLPPPRQFVPDLPVELERVLFKALAKQPEDRYADISLFAAALENLRVEPKGKTNQPSSTIPSKIQDGETVDTRLEMGAFGQLSDFPFLQRKNKIWLVVGSLIILAILAIIVVWNLSQRPSASHEAQVTPGKVSTVTELATATSSREILVTSNPVQAMPAYTSTPQVSSTRPVSPTPNKPVARISAKLAEVNLRRTPGYVNKYDLTDVVVKVPPRALVIINSGPEKKDGLNWYNVTWGEYSGWIADRTGTGRVILEFDQNSTGH